MISHNREESCLLQDYLRTAPDIVLIGSFSSITEAEKAIQDTKPEILFAPASVLSILLLTGIPAPILVAMDTPVTADPVLQSNVFGWITTPFTYERVLSLLHTIERHLLQKVRSREVMQNFVFIKSEYKLIKINLAEILFLSGLRDYTQIFVKGKISPYTTLQNLKDFETKLPENAFIRVHRSYIVSLQQIDAISRNEIIIGTHTIPIGNAYRPFLDEMIIKNS